MLDSYIRPVLAPLLEQMAAPIVRMGYTANTMTLCGVVAGILTFLVLPFGYYGFVVFFLLLNRLFDGLDGAVARLRQKQGLEKSVTDIGGYFDIVSDFIFYAGFIFFFAMGQSSQGMIAAFLLFSYMGTSTTFLGFAILAAKKNIPDQVEPTRSIFYLGGLAGGSETLLVMLLMCVAPVFFPIIAIIFGIICWLTTYGRIREAIRVFG